VLRAKTNIECFDYTTLYSSRERLEMELTIEDKYTATLYPVSEINDRIILHNFGMLNVVFLVVIIASYIITEISSNTL
jgi:hypothetical protein